MASEWKVVEVGQNLGRLVVFGSFFWPDGLDMKNVWMLAT